MRSPLTLERGYLIWRSKFKNYELKTSKLGGRDDNMFFYCCFVRHLSREIMRLSELNKKDSSLHSSCESFEHDTPQTPSSERGPSPPRRQSRGRAKGSAQTQHLGDVLTDIDVLKKSLLQLSADVSQTRPREPDIGICKGVSSSDESGKQLDHRIAESANSSSPIVGNGRPVISDVTTPGTYSGVPNDFVVIIFELMFNFRSIL